MQGSEWGPGVGRDSIGTSYTWGATHRGVPGQLRDAERPSGPRLGVFHHVKAEVANEVTCLPTVVCGTGRDPTQGLLCCEHLRGQGWGPLLAGWTAFPRGLGPRPPWECPVGTSPVS